MSTPRGIAITVTPEIRAELDRFDAKQAEIKAALDAQMAAMLTASRKPGASWAEVITAGLTA